MLNQCQFIGNVGQDPEIRHTQDGKSVGSLSLACSERWRSKDGEQKERTEWVRIVCFNDGLNKVIAQYVKKGARLFVQGKMQTRKWQDQSGSDKYTTEIVLQGFDAKLSMLDRKGEENASQDNSGGYGGQSQGNSIGGQSSGHDIDDEIPFAPEMRG